MFLKSIFSKVLVWLVLFSFLIFPFKILAKDFICGVYFTGIGCPHCAKTDPVIFEKLIKNYPNLIIIEYEIYHQKKNILLLQKYCFDYDLKISCGIPLIFFGSQKENILSGDIPILRNIENKIKEKSKIKCALPDQKEKEFEKLDLTLLPGQFKIWRKDRILIRESKNKFIFGWNGKISNLTLSQEKENSKELLLELIETDNISEVVSKINGTLRKNLEVLLSGRKVFFENAIEFEIKKAENVAIKKELSLPKILSLAIADSVNPCALAVLTLILLAILTFNPENKKKVLLAGFSFVLAVFLMYFVYGILIIKFFQLIQALTPIKIYLYKILGIGAIILGILNLKDFIRYKPGGFLTEMPLFLRPKVKKIISGVTSEKGAFFVGLFVTLFLLPCTIGPYVIAGGILSSLEILKTLPWLFLYNLIFVFPMVAITLFVYFGLTKIKNVAEWKDKNIKYLHLIAGLAILAVGIAMVFG